MASSVLGKQAFSQGGITISKHCNGLKGDIVDALQCVKCAVHCNILFHEPGPSSSVEEEPDEYEIETVPNEQLGGNDDEEDEEGWETLFLEEDEDDFELDFVTEE
jgi:hypothetical protein